MWLHQMQVALQVTPNVTAAEHNVMLDAADDCGLGRDGVCAWNASIGGRGLMPHAAFRLEPECLPQPPGPVHSLRDQPSCSHQLLCAFWILILASRSSHASCRRSIRRAVAVMADPHGDVCFRTLCALDNRCPRVQRVSCRCLAGSDQALVWPRLC